LEGYKKQFRKKGAAEGGCCVICWSVMCEVINVKSLVWDGVEC
jgi:hypothetical protein